MSFISRLFGRGPARESFTAKACDSGKLIQIDKTAFCQDFASRTGWEETKIRKIVDTISEKENFNIDEIRNKISEIYQQHLASDRLSTGPLPAPARQADRPNDRLALKFLTENCNMPETIAKNVLNELKGRGISTKDLNENRMYETIQKKSYCFRSYMCMQETKQILESIPQNPGNRNLNTLLIGTIDALKNATENSKAEVYYTTHLSLQSLCRTTIDAIQEIEYKLPNGSTERELLRAHRKDLEHMRTNMESNTDYQWT